MKTFFSTSIEYIETTDDGEQFLVSTVFPNAYGDNAVESEENAIAGFVTNAKSYGYSAKDIMSITTVELDELED
jgi:hypothetical protein